MCPWTTIFRSERVAPSGIWLRAVAMIDAFAADITFWPERAARTVEPSTPCTARRHLDGFVDDFVSGGMGEVLALDPGDRETCGGRGRGLCQGAAGYRPDGCLLAIWARDCPAATAFKAEAPAPTAVPMPGTEPHLWRPPRDSSD